jgi:DUF971 family protein
MDKIQQSSPISITADRQAGSMTIQWGDGHISQYSFGLLRAACPCASCRGGHEYMSPVPDTNVFSIELSDSPATHLRSLEGVGSYAITLEWEDGHHYGIYNWHYLRALCPCPDCRKEQDDVG